MHFKKKVLYDVGNAGVKVRLIVVDTPLSNKTSEAITAYQASYHDVSREDEVLAQKKSVNPLFLLRIIQIKVVMAKNLQHSSLFHS